MVKKHMRSADKLYHIHGRTYEHLEGSRAQVWHQTAYKTSGGLEKHQLMQNKHGRIVSRKKHGTAKKEKRLEKAGYKTRERAARARRVAARAANKRPNKKLH